MTIILIFKLFKILWLILNLRKTYYVSENFSHFSILRGKYIKEKWLRSEKKNFVLPFWSLSLIKWCTAQNYGRINANFHCFGDLAVWLIFWFHKARLPKHWILNGASNKRKKRSAQVSHHHLNSSQHHQSSQMPPIL